MDGAPFLPCVSSCSVVVKLVDEVDRRLNGRIRLSEKELQKKQRYQQLVKERAPKKTVAKNLFYAFLLGGSLGLVGQALFDFFMHIEPAKSHATATTLAGLVFIGAVLTGLGVYDKLAAWGGAGAAVPITGFANSIVSAAMEFRREGLVLGLPPKMFVIAGPVLVYGTLAGFLTGLLKIMLTGGWR
jgi:stage V sporulation protein AC